MWPVKTASRSRRRGQEGLILGDSWDPGTRARRGPAGAAAAWTACPFASSPGNGTYCYASECRRAATSRAEIACNRAVVIKSLSSAKQQGFRNSSPQGKAQWHGRCPPADSQPQRDSKSTETKPQARTLLLRPGVPSFISPGSICGLCSEAVRITAFCVTCISFAKGNCKAASPQAGSPHLEAIRGAGREVYKLSNLPQPCQSLPYTDVLLVPKQRSREFLQLTPGIATRRSRDGAANCLSARAAHEAPAPHNRCKLSLRYQVSDACRSSEPRLGKAAAKSNLTPATSHSKAPRSCDRSVNTSSSTQGLCSRTCFDLSLRMRESTDRRARHPRLKSELRQLISLPHDSVALMVLRTFEVSPRLHRPAACAEAPEASSSARHGPAASRLCL